MLGLQVDQKNELERRLRKARDASERTRLCVILGYNDGRSIEELARVLRIGHSTVYDYLKEFDTQQKTKNDPRGGTEAKLTAGQAQVLLKHLTEVTYLKAKQICAYVKAEYGKTYSRSGMTEWLQAHGFVFKRPKKVPGKLDPTRQALFVEGYSKLKADLRPGEEIYFMDAVHPEHQSQASCGWIKKGEQKTLQTSGKQLRLHFAGAVCLTGMKIFTKEYDTVDANAMLDFFKDLENASKASKIYVVLDNARANKNKKIDSFLKTSKIELHYLPPYSPNLNPIERLWKIMRESKLYNRYYDSSVTFFKEIRTFFTDDVPKKAHNWASRINDNFQVVKLNPIKLSV